MHGSDVGTDAEESEEEDDDKTKKFKSLESGLAPGDADNQLSGTHNNEVTGKNIETNEQFNLDDYRDDVSKEKNIEDDKENVESEVGKHEDEVTEEEKKLLLADPNLKPQSPEKNNSSKTETEKKKKGKKDGTAQETVD